MAVSDFLVKFVSSYFDVFAILLVSFITAMVISVQRSAKSKEDLDGKMAVVSAVIGLLSMLFALLGVFKVPAATVKKLKTDIYPDLMRDLDARIHLISDIVDEKICSLMKAAPKGFIANSVLGFKEFKCATPRSMP
jgi:spore maturation protein SpmA